MLLYGKDFVEKIIEEKAKKRFSIYKEILQILFLNAYIIKDV